MNIILKFIIVLTLLLLPTFSNAYTFDELLEKEEDYLRNRLNSAGTGLRNSYKGTEKYNKYKEIADEARNKRDSLSKIDPKDKNKILEQITNNINDRSERIKSEIEEEQKQIASAKEIIKKNPIFYVQMTGKIYMHSWKIKDLENEQKYFEMQQKLLKIVQKNINTSKLKETVPVTTKTSTLDKFKKLLQTKKTTTPVPPKKTTTSTIDKFKKFKAQQATKKPPTAQQQSNALELLKKKRKELLDAKNKKSTHRIAIETPRIKEKGVVIQAIKTPLPPKKPTNRIMPPPKITPPKPKPQVAQKGDGKTVLKNVNILTSAKTGNINTKGKLNIANVNVAKGTTLKDTNINSDVNVKNISVSKGSSADIGSVKIEN